MDEPEAAVRLLLSNCGFDPPDEDIAALAELYAETRALAESLFTVAEARGETSELAFRVTPPAAH